METISAKSDTSTRRTHTFNVLGIDVQITNEELLSALVSKWIREKKSAYVCFADVHSIMLCQSNEAARHALENADFVSPDGTPLVWVGKYLHNEPAKRVCGPDFLPYLVKSTADKNYRHYFYGGKPDVVEKLVTLMAQKFPAAKIAGWHSPPFRVLTEDEEKSDVEKIRAARPDIVWVGLGAPKQEIWMKSHKHLFDGTVLLGVGAAFDMHAGQVARAPLWMRENGLEWLHRLSQEPKRLWRRYLLLAPMFVWKIFRERRVANR